MEIFKEQHGWDKYGLQHPYPGDFSIPWWQRKKEIPFWFFLYRTIFCMYFVITFIYVITGWCLQSDLQEGDCGKSFIFFSFWVYFVNFVTALLGFIVCCIAYVKQRRNLPPAERLSLLTKTFWILYTVTLPNSIISLAVYFIGVAPFEKDRFPVNALFIVLHIPNVIFYVIDFCLVSFPFRFFHEYMNTFFPSAYITFAFIYQVSDGTGVKGERPILEWVDFEEAFYKTCFYLALLPIAGAVLHRIFSFLYVGKLICVFRYQNRE